MKAAVKRFVSIFRSRVLTANGDPGTDGHCRLWQKHFCVDRSLDHCKASHSRTRRYSSDCIEKLMSSQHLKECLNVNVQ